MRWFFLFIRSCPPYSKNSLFYAAFLRWNNSPVVCLLSLNPALVVWCR